MYYLTKNNVHLILQPEMIGLSDSLTRLLMDRWNCVTSFQDKVEINSFLLRKLVTMREIYLQRLTV